jgi:hypothetical protein
VQFLRVTKLHYHRTLQNIALEVFSILKRSFFFCFWFDLVMNKVTRDEFKLQCEVEYYYIYICPCGAYGGGKRGAQGVGGET